MDFIQVLLAQFIDKFKAGSPGLWAILAVVFTAIFAGATDPLFATLVGEDVASQVTKWVGYIMALLVGSRTTSVLSEAKTAKEQK